ncbi:MAG: 8-amino-7-oxononanoate synthase [Pseudomonadota bacterium]|nr:8-amino-7-oxononanoate synthase [Pseudomonadota bacterium]
MTGNESRYDAYLRQRRKAGLYRELTALRREDARRITVGGRSYVNFSGNDYLGLANDPRLAERAAEWAKRHGAGSAASRLVTGNLDLFTRIEEKTARLKGQEAALVLASGFQANAAVLEALLDSSVLGAEPLVFADRLNHASMHFGCKAAGVRQIRYRHCDASHLSELLERHAASTAPKFILTESVFSMDGDVAPLDELGRLARAHDALLVVDDAHATGILGEGGKGLGEGADVVIGTFSKAVGSFGAYVACSGRVKQYLVNRCTGLIYSTALPPSVLGSIDAALDIVPSMEADRARVAALARRFREIAAEHGLDCGASRTQIVPLMAGDADRALTLAAALREAGFWAVAIRPPTVPQGTARLRLAFNAAHTDEDVEQLLSAVKTGMGKRLAIA